ncbi:NAD(P)-binding protein [Annulohypoxylon truncatum]|uniref:NAD(P)-binding protein n=1 Tax=Annulohypoxylon truncatum TaxID=327061 RepID=UPI0020075CD0|nr:NAD(P)-binding protein [Annulohypoxylon truncatum]KAI1204282.1 NAD(P)-binding protein [Annulohypoxylon truncatum]
MSFYSYWTQFFPPRDGAPITEANVSRLDGKVFIVTGGSSGIGYELARVLYGAGGKVYMLTRTKKNAEEAIDRIKAHYADKDAKTGSLEFVSMDLSDFKSVKAAAQQFLDSEGPDGRLDVLFNNAGTGGWKDAPPTPQGHEYHITANSVGHFLLARLLTPILSQTAKKSPKNTVRVVWAASILVEMTSPISGITKEFLEDPFCEKHAGILYAQSKTGNWFLATEFARHQSESGPFGSDVVHIGGNPGSYNTNIWRHVKDLIKYYLVYPTLRDPVYGAYTYMWMGFSNEVTMEAAKAGNYAICDGRWHPGQRADLLLAIKGEDEGGSGRSKEFFDWCEEKVKNFMN